ncbi:MAG TPA: hypothetical protein VIV60_05725 [Polyangiaceae bacterium]
MTTPLNLVSLARCVLGASVSLVLFGCGPQFDAPSKLQSLRILAIKKDRPYLRPTPSNEDDTPVSKDSALDYVEHMTLAMEDSRLDADKLDENKKPKPLQKLWFAGCNNPPGDNYFSCLLNVWLSFKAFKELGPGAAGLADGEGWSVAEHVSEIGQANLLAFVSEAFPKQYSEMMGLLQSDPTAAETALQGITKPALALRVGAGDVFDYKVPSWVIAEHPRSSDENIPRYGFSQVFLAVCDGEIDFSPGWETVEDPLAVLADATRGFPLTCYEPGTKNERGPDNFMVAYSNLYVYDDERVTNANPVISGFNFDGKPLDKTTTCVGAACLTMDDTATCDDPNSPAKRVKLCKKNSSSDCKEYDVEPDIMESIGPDVELGIEQTIDNSEEDFIASTAGGGDNKHLFEQMWIRYYADAGDIKNDAKRLQDATEGWFGEHTTKWKVPTEGTGPVHIWSVVYDNRGGVDWVRATVCLEE